MMKWNPLFTLHREMNRVFEEVFRDAPNYSPFRRVDAR